MGLLKKPSLLQLDLSASLSYVVDRLSTLQVDQPGSADEEKARPWCIVNMLGVSASNGSNLSHAPTPKALEIQDNKPQSHSFEHI
jgi:hypothetical protein